MQVRTHCTLPATIPIVIEEVSVEDLASRSLHRLHRNQVLDDVLLRSHVGNDWENPLVKAAHVVAVRALDRQRWRIGKLEGDVLDQVVDAVVDFVDGRSHVFKNPGFTAICSTLESTPERRSRRH